MAIAKAKFIRMSPRKLRRVINEVRGKHATDAKVVLKFMPYAAARVIEKVLNSAVANAKNNDHLNPEDLKISQAYVDQSTTLRRWRAMSRGRGFPILKRTSHVTIEVAPSDQTVKRKFKDIKFISDYKHEHKHALSAKKQDHEHEKEVKSKKKEKSRTGEKEKIEQKIKKAEKAEKESKEKQKKTKEKKKKKEEE